MKPVYLLLTVALFVGCGDKDDHHAPRESQHDPLATQSRASVEHHEKPIVRLTDEQISAARIEVVSAGPAVIREHIKLYGTIAPNAERVRSVSARFPGVIQRVYKRVGDTVTAGERLASVESNDSLKSYAIEAPLRGVITERNASEGEHTRDSPLFIVADLSSVWAEIALFPRDVPNVSVGQAVEVTSAERSTSATGRIVYIAPLGTRASQTRTARVLLDNATGQWPPGLYVSASVRTGETQADIVVASSGIQSLENQPVVFVKTVDGFEPRPIQLGKRDEQWTQVVSGLQPGEQYAATNSFTLKSELGASDADHDH